MHILPDLGQRNEGETNIYPRHAAQLSIGQSLCQSCHHLAISYHTCHEWNCKTASLYQNHENNDLVYQPRSTKCLCVTASTHIAPPQAVGQHSCFSLVHGASGPHDASQMSTGSVGGHEPTVGVDKENPTRDKAEMHNKQMKIKRKSEETVMLRACSTTYD